MQWINHSKVDLLEWAYALQFLSGALDKADDLNRVRVMTNNSQYFWV